MSFIFVDCEARYDCPCPNDDVLGGGMTEFGAVELESVRAGQPKTFHGKPGEPIESDLPRRLTQWYMTMVEFEKWLKSFDHNPIFWSDNPAFDWQWINYYFHHTIHRNPFGHSARRIGDFYAGLVGDTRAASRWKRLRITPHDHNPVHDALGNAEAFIRILNGERA